MTFCLIFIYSSFVLMSFEFGLSSALNAVGFIQTLKFAFKEADFNHLPDWIFTYEINSIIQINPLACVLVACLTLIMLRGIKESIMLNNIFTVCILVFFGYCNVLSYAIFDKKVAQPFFLHGA